LLDAAAFAYKIAVLEQTLKQYEAEYNQKADEVDLL